MSPTLLFWLLLAATYAAVWAVLARGARAVRQGQELRESKERTLRWLW